MRIAFIGPFGLAPKGSMQVRALPLARALAARGHAVLVLMPPWQTPTEAGRCWQDGQVAVEYVPLDPGRAPLYPLAVLRLVARALAWQADVVHCFKPKAYAGLAAWLLWHRRRLGLASARLVVDEDDWEGPGGWNDLEPYGWLGRRLFAWQERWGLRHNDAVTVASRTLQSLVWSLGVPPARVHYVPNGAIVRVPGPAANDVRQTLGLVGAPVVLLYTRFFEYHVARVVAVFQRIVAAMPTARLLVVGRGLFPEDDARFDELVRAAGLAASVVRAGWVAAEDLAGYFAAADVALYPFDDTLVNRAKCAVKLTDLLAAGLAVVADAVGQNGEYIVHNESGLLVAPGDVAAMAEAALRVLAESDLRQRLGAGARQRLASCYTWDVLVDRVLAAYGEQPDHNTL